MSKKKKIFSILFGAIGACLVVLIGILLLITSGLIGVKEITLPKTPQPLDAELLDMVSRYKKGEISEIDISSLTTFSWDRLYFFGAYDTSEYMDSEIGNSWRNTCGYEAIGLESSDSYDLLVFTNNGTVVSCFIHPKGKYPFDLLPQQYGKPGFSRQEAHFIVDKDGWLVVANKK